jgi:hypothetical protein
MKKLLLVLLICTLLPICSIAETIQEATVTPAVDIANDPILAEAQLGNYKVAITGARLVNDYEGKPCIVVSFRWSHNEAEAKSFMLAFSNKLFQNGLELETAILMDNSVDVASAMLDLKAGYEQNTQAAYRLNDTTSKVEIEVTELFSFTSTDKLSFAFNLQ